MLVERGSATELAAALEGLIRDAGRRRELGMEGYRSFQRNFTWKTVHRPLSGGARRAWTGRSRRPEDISRGCEEH